MVGLLSVVSCAREGWLPPVAEQGVLDLRAWRPAAHGALRLDGQWAIYPRQLLAPGDAALARTPETFHNIPGAWGTSVRPPDGRPGHGYATYALRVRLPASAPLLALHVSSVGTAYRLFIDGLPVTEVGWVATTPALGRPRYLPQIVRFVPGPDRVLDLLVQVSNYHYAQGGILEAIWLGSAPSIGHWRESRITLATFLAGAFTVFGISHLMLWGGGRGSPSMLFFAIFCFASAIRGVTIDEMYLADLLPGLSWEMLVRLDYASLLVMVATTAPFLLKLFPLDMPQSLMRFYIWTSLAGIVLITVLSPDSFSRGYRVLQVFCLSAALVASVQIARAYRRGRSGAGLFLFGILAITTTGLHDLAISLDPQLAVSRWPVPQIRLQSLGLLAFVLSQASLLALRSGQAARSLRRAHAEIDAHARELEDRVTERTVDLEQANQQLARLAEIDGLTNLGNRRFFEEELRRAWFDHLRREATLALLLIDVDHFKAYNDHYGHVAGDEALRQVAGTVARCMKRPRDVVARYGGEEIVALLADTDIEGAEHLARQISAQLAANRIPHEASPVSPNLTVSIGVAAMIPQADLEPSQIVEAADAALYRAKEEGRNRVVAA